MNRLRFSSVLASVSICLILVMSINLNTYHFIFGANNVEFPGGLECFVNMGVYPLSGLLFAFFERKSKINEFVYLAGGALSSLLLFILFGFATLFVSPEGFSDAVNQTITGIKLVYIENNFAGIIGMILGFIYALFMFSLLGGTSSFLLSLFIKEEEKATASTNGT